MRYHEKRRDAIERIVQQYLCDYDRPPTEEELTEERRKRGITRARVKGPPTVVQFPRERHRDKRCVSFLLFPDRKAPRPGREIEASETERSLLQGLSAHDQQIMHMHYWGGLTTREIAEKLGLKRSSIENRVRLSLAFLRDTLKPRGERVA